MFEKYGSQVDFEKTEQREINMASEQLPPPQSAAI